MIPDKRKDQRKWRELSKEEQNKILAKPPLTDLQKLAQKENYALFVLKSLHAQLNHLYRLHDPIIHTRILNLKTNLEACETRIKQIQFHRKEMKRISKL